MKHVLVVDDSLEDREFVLARAPEGDAYWTTTVRVSPGGTRTRSEYTPRSG